MAVNSKNNLLYIAGYNFTKGTISVINGSTGKVVRTDFVKGIQNIAINKYFGRN